MDELSQRAEPVVKDMLQAKRGELFQQLGLVLETIKKNPSAAGYFELPHEEEEEALGLGDDVVRNLKEFGEKFYDRVSKDAYNLVCSSHAEETKERKELLDAFKLGPVAVAASMAAFLIAQLGLSPLVAPVVAAITVKLFFKNAHAAMCDVWKDNTREIEK